MSRHFEERMSVALSEAAATGGVVTLAITDLDHFKKFNDTWGHKVGDLVLTETAQRLQALAKTIPGATAFRYGGEEFCLLLRDTGTDEAHAHLERRRAEVETMALSHEEQALDVTVSIGLCEFPTNCPRPKTCS